VRYFKYFILDILSYFSLYIGYINKIQKHVPPYNISHISLISLIFSKVLRIPTGIKAIVFTTDRMEENMSHVAIPLFDGESYDLWAVRMQTYLEGLDLWEVVEEDNVPLSENPTVAQMKVHKEKKTRKTKAKSCLFAGVSQMIMTKIMTLKSPKEIWEYLKAEYEGNEKIRGMKILNLIREFEMQRMKESETIKEYLNKLLGIANKIKLLGKEFPDSRLVKKIFLTVPDIKCHKCGQLGHVEKVCKSKDSEEDVQIVENKSDEDKSEEDLLFTMCYSQQIYKRLDYR